MLCLRNGKEGSVDGDEWARGRVVRGTDNREQIKVEPQGDLGEFAFYYTLGEMSGLEQKSDVIWVTL